MNEMNAYRQQSEIQTDNQSRLQQEAADAQARQVAPQMREQLAEAQAAVIAQTDPRKSLNQVLQGFRGKIQDEYGNYAKIGAPLMNEHGIAVLAGFLTPILNDSTRFGDIPPSAVRDHTEDIINQITQDLGWHWREYGISGTTINNIIIADLTVIVRLALSRSENGGEKSFLSRVILESVGGQPKKKKESTWDKYFKM